MAPPSWAFQVENFVTKPDEELICSICHSVFCDPAMSPCDHVFCEQCINKWLQNNRNCPICRERLPRWSIKQKVPIVRNLIMKLVLYCRNKECGCEAQFSLESCETHMKDCAFELMQCKNKPCEEKLFRKDIKEHETNKCCFRCIKCTSCGCKISVTEEPGENHNCITALQLCNKRKNLIIRKRNEKIKELEKEIKSLKEGRRTRSSSDTTSVELLPEADFASLDSSGSRYDIILEDNWAANTDEEPYDLVPYDENEFRNMGSQTNDDLGNESPNRNNSSPENENNVQEEQISEFDERSRRRPPKRRLSPTSFSTSDEDNHSDGQPRSSPKRTSICPLSNCSRSTNNTAESGPPDSTSNSFMQAGPSASCDAGDQSDSSDDDFPLNRRSQLRSTSEQSARTSRKKNSRIEKLKKKSKALQGGAVFAQTLSLLEQYNLESDPEWLPEYASHTGNTPSPSESDSSFGPKSCDSSSSLSDSDTDFSSRI